VEDYLPRRRAPPQFVEEFRRRGEMDIPLLVRRSVQLREHSKALAVRRRVVGQNSAEAVS
jgi:hypothetical protein